MFDAKSVFNILLGSTPFPAYKSNKANHVDSPVVYTIEEFQILSAKKIYLKCDVIDGSVVNGSRQILLYTFVFDKPRDIKFF